MKSRSTRLMLEALDDRSLPSTVAFGDFNHDGRTDTAAITGPTAITVSLANPDGSYTVSAVLSGPSKQTIVDVSVADVDGDGNLDATTVSLTKNDAYVSKWLGNGNGTFDGRTTEKIRWPFGHVGHGGTF